MNPVGLGVESLSVKKEHYTQYITHTYISVSHINIEIYVHAQTQW